MNIRLGISILFLSAFLFILDNQSAKYGNGVFTTHKNLVLGTGIIKINQTYITYDRDWKHEGFIMPNSNFITNGNKDTIHVEKIIGYAIQNNCLFLEIKSDTNQFWIFKNKESVYNKEPLILSSLKEKVNWVNLSHKPTLYKYWNLIAYAISALLIFLLALLFYRVSNIL